MPPPLSYTPVYPSPSPLLSPHSTLSPLPYPFPLSSLSHINSLSSSPLPYPSPSPLHSPSPLTKPINHRRQNLNMPLMFRPRTNNNKQPQCVVSVVVPPDLYPNRLWSSRFLWDNKKKKKKTRGSFSFPPRWDGGGKGEKG